MSSDSLRARSPFFAFDTETGSRRPRWVALVAGLLAILVIVTGVGVGVGSANAHTPTFKVDCYGVTLKLDSYNNNNGGVNTLEVIINGVQKTKLDNFTSFPETYYKFDNPAGDNSYSVIVVAHDGNANNDYNVTRVGLAPKCDAPDATLAATECNTINGTSTVTATFSKLLNGLTYTAQLYKNDVAYDAAFTPSTVSSKIWTNMDAGVTYKLTVTATNYPGLTVTKQVAVVGCPQNNALVVAVAECTSPTTPNASVLVTASQLVPGRTYTATLYQGATALTTVPVTQGGNASVQFSIPVAPSLSGLTVVLTDTLAKTTVTSAGFATKACPTDPGAPTVVPAVCTEVGKDSTLTVTVSLTNLTVGRVYLIQIDGAQVDEITAGGGSQGGLVYTVAPGVHTVTIVDKLVPALTKTSDPVDVVACPTQPVVALSLVQCSVPGGKGSVTASFSGLAVGRSYLLAITENGNAVAAYPDVTIDSATTSKVFANLVPGATYTVTIVDKAATNVIGSSSRTLNVCPDTPTISVVPKCELLSNTTFYGVTLDKLQGGQQYLVTIKDAGGADAAPPVTVTGGAGGLAPTFQVPNGKFYTVAVTNVATPAITASASVYAAVCELPTFDLPPEFPDLPTLALTGAGDTTMPMLGALGLVQFGVALLALAAMLQFGPRRRLA